jgi:hypothetical protein
MKIFCSSASVRVWVCVIAMERRSINVRCAWLDSSFCWNEESWNDPDLQKKSRVKPPRENIVHLRAPGTPGQEK